MPIIFTVLWTLAFLLREYLLHEGRDYAADRVSAICISVAVLSVKPLIERWQPTYGDNTCWLIAALIALTIDCSYYRWRRKKSRK